MFRAYKGTKSTSVKALNTVWRQSAVTQYRYLVLHLFSCIIVWPILRKKYNALDYNTLAVFFSYKCAFLILLSYFYRRILFMTLKYYQLKF